MAPGGNPPPPSTPVNHSATSLKNAHVWEITAPLPIPGVGGHTKTHFLPATLTPANRRRRVSIEVHRVKSVFESTSVASSVDVDPLTHSGDGTDTEICYVRILEHRTVNPANFLQNAVTDKFFKEPAKKAKKGNVNFFTGTLRSGHKEKSEDGAAGGRDDDSVGEDASFMDSFREVSSSIIDSSKKAGGNVDTPFEGWIPKYKIPLRMFHITEVKKRSVIVAYEHRGHRSHREFIFDTEEGVAEFVSQVEKNTELLEGRSKAQLQHALGSIKLQKEEELTLLFDICSASRLPSGDIGQESDPYITVRFNGRKIHRTGRFSNEPNPIWTLQKGALFIWKVDALELFRSEDGLIFEVKDYDTIGTNESLGAFNVNAKTLYKWNGERREFALKPLLGEPDYGQGKVSLRVRRATDHDVEFMEKFNAKERKRDMISRPTIGTTLKGIMTVNTKKEKEGPDKGKTKYLVRPGPDPKRKDETAWLTKEKIEEETKQPSYNWTDIGSGTLGKIFVEILGCDNLPNMDTGGVLGNKTDSFVSLVYEDCFAQTDVVSDCLSPRWMPWTQRAFVFNMMHTSSQLFLGVFDSDSMSNHDMIGRISVDLSNTRSNIVYVLQYNLYKTAKSTPREAKFGTIRIRLRLELEDERTRLLSNFTFPGSVYVNVHTKKDYEVIYQTVEGGVDTKAYALGTINSYYEEIMSYLTIYYVLEDVFISLLLWRGHSSIPIPLPDYSTRSVKWVEVQFPLHSFLAFVCTISLVENSNLLPSFCFGCIGWILLACQENRRVNPNPWMRCKSLSHFWSSLIMGRSHAQKYEVTAHENVDSIKEAGSFWEKRVREAEEKARVRAEEYEKEQEQYLKDMEEIGDASEDLVTTKVGGFSILDPAKPYLYPIQQYLGIVCTWIRVLKNIMTWEESYLSFWITIISFALSVIAFFVPWSVLIKWILRIIVWVAFGPWMKLADMFYFSQLGKETDEQKKERMNQLQRERQKRLDKQKLEAQIAREKRAKLRDFKQYMFGEHICKVNILKKDRYYDLPLPTSSATIFKPKERSLGELAMQEAGYHRTRVDGQHLVGDMIPKIYDTPSTEAPTGQPTKKANLLEKGSPAALYDSNDSYSAAALKVGSIVVGAGAITWYGVPLFVYLIRLVLPKDV